ncbi:putative protein phosphatase 2C 54 [Capsicum baccatum]|uniref:Endopeptidase Clp n=1 Tax=Capsicum baccatum TaxID=33114 RepID=A0A2G2VF31_CAPBA|nr:putative protein phosphatase 2C 54 [Capsicum baccatum]
MRLSILASGSKGKRYCIADTKVMIHQPPETSDVEATGTYLPLDFASLTLTESDFDAKPTVMLLGQYSTGKITFIKHLLKCNYPDDSTVGNFPPKELKKLSPMPTKEVTGSIRNVSLIDDASYVWRLCQIRFINKEVLSKMESISEDTTIADRKQIPFNKFLPTLRSGVWSDIGGCRDMEDTQICIADMAKNFGHSIRGEESISFYGVFDGHGGKGAALFVRDCLPRIIVQMR